LEAKRELKLALPKKFDPETIAALQSLPVRARRFTLLALNEFNYLEGTQHIDGFFDDLSVSWQAASMRGEAEAFERAELRGAYHYPLNIQGNRRAELLKYVRHLKSARSAYKQRYV
jgi:GIY-YIG catalytic domain